MDRKKFIKDASLGCLGLTLFTHLSSCSTIPVIQTSVIDQKIEVPIIQMIDKSALKLRIKSLPYDVVLLKRVDGSYYSIYLQCTHQDTSVYYDGKNFQCPMHGSSFAADGKVITGPATKSLKSLETTIANEKIIIQFKD